MVSKFIWYGKKLHLVFLEGTQTKPAKQKIYSKRSENQKAKRMKKVVTILLQEFMKGKIYLKLK